MQKNAIFQVAPPTAVILSSTSHRRSNPSLKAKPIFSFGHLSPNQLVRWRGYEGSGEITNRFKRFSDEMKE
ncbi:Endoglucanase [Dirofilaria immitis]